MKRIKKMSNLKGRLSSCLKTIDEMTKEIEQMLEVLEGKKCTCVDCMESENAKKKKRNKHGRS